MSRGNSSSGGEWQLFVEEFALETYNFTKVKYGTLGEIFFASEKEGIRKLSYSKIFKDFEIFCQKKNIKCCSQNRFVTYFKSELNVRLKVPRSISAAHVQVLKFK